jgi:hypothetical protein
MLVDGRILRMGLPESFERDLGLLGMGTENTMRMLLWFVSLVVILFACGLRSDVATHRDRKIKQAYARGIAAAWARYRYELPDWLKGPRPFLLIGCR